MTAAQDDCVHDGVMPGEQEVTEKQIVVEGIPQIEEEIVETPKKKKGGLCGCLAGLKKKKAKKEEEFTEVPATDAEAEKPAEGEPAEAAVDVENKEE